MPAAFPVTEHIVKTARHTTFYLACGEVDAPLIVFAHGWPELSISWRHQLAAFAALGFRAVAPDMRGYGRSSVPTRHEDYAMTHIVADMVELIDALGRERVIWVGHDWGAPVVWSLASHHPERCVGIANLCVPYFAEGFAPAKLIPTIDRSIYPEAEFPAGQWDYMLFYEENFAAACAPFDANPTAAVKATFRSGNPVNVAKPAPLAFVRRNGGWFGGAAQAPDLPRDEAIVGEEDLSKYAAALTRNGFSGPASWYMNEKRNLAYALTARDGGRLTLPVLFLHGAYDLTCYTLNPRLVAPMRASCADLTEAIVPSGHWMAQEKPVAVNVALAKWLATKALGSFG